MAGVDFVLAETVKFYRNTKVFPKSSDKNNRDVKDGAFRPDKRLKEYGGMDVQVNASFCQPANQFLNAAAVNRSLSKDGTIANVQKDKNRDQVTLSPQGKAMSAIENLTKQKDAIMERKNALIGKTLENDGDMEAIQPQLDMYNEQLETIDKQIAQITAQQLEQAAKKDEEKKSDKADENKTEEQIETENLSNLANATKSIKDAELVSSVKNKVDGEVRVKKTEIKMGELQIIHFQDKAACNPGTNVSDIIAHLREGIKVKENLVSELESKVLDLDASQGKKINEAIAKLNGKDSKDKKADEQQKPEDSAVEKPAEDARNNGESPVKTEAAEDKAEG